MKKVFLFLLVSGMGMATLHAQSTTQTTTPAPGTAVKTMPGSVAPNQTPSKAMPPSAPGGSLPATEVPDAVKTKFAAANASAKDVTWRKMGNNYGAFYRENGRMTNIIYGPNGDVMRSYKQIDPAALPQSVTDYITKNLPGEKVTSASEVMRGNGMTQYDVMAGNRRMSFDSNGKLLTPMAPKMPQQTTPGNPTTAPTNTTPTTTPK